MPLTEVKCGWLKKMKETFKQRECNSSARLRNEDNKKSEKRAINIREKTQGGKMVINRIQKYRILYLHS